MQASRSHDMTVSPSRRILRLSPRPPRRLHSTASAERAVVNAEIRSIGTVAGLDQGVDRQPDRRRRDG